MIDKSNYQNVQALSQSMLMTYNKAYLRYNFRSNAFDAPMTILLGARGVGKTTLMVQKLLQSEASTPESILFLPLDHVIMTGKNLYDIAKFGFTHGLRFLAIDEIHKYPRWPTEVKSLRDELPGLKILASGSSAIEIQKSSRDLSRRAITTNMYGLSFREYLEIKFDLKIQTVDLTDLLERHKDLGITIQNILLRHGVNLAGEFLLFQKSGYYPYRFDLQDEELYYLTVTQSLNATLESEIPSQHENLPVSASYKFRRLLGVLATIVPYEFELKKMMALTDVADERTLKTYLKYLEQAQLIISMNKSGAGLKALRKPDKIYLDNTNLLYALSPNRQVNAGTRRELFFINSIRVTHALSLAAKTDFVVQGKYNFEIGGPSKDFSQIKDLKNSYLVVDDVLGERGSIPLWLFGFLY